MDKKEHKRNVSIITISGYSGSGKSTLAKNLAEALPDTIFLRSDVIRKQIFGVPETEKLPPEAYKVEIHILVREEMQRLTKEALENGKNVIIDAALIDEEARKSQEDYAEKLGVSFVGIWVDVKPETLFERVEARKNDASDAGVDVVKKQLTYNHGKNNWAKLDGHKSPENVLEQALKVLKSNGSKKNFKHHPPSGTNDRP